MGSLLELRWHRDSGGYILDMHDMTLTDQMTAIANSPMWSRPYRGEGENLISMLKGLTNNIFADDEGEHEHVIPRGGRSKSYRCKGNDLSILGDLLHMPGTPEGVLAFVEQWGLLAAPADEKLRRVAAFISNRDALARFLIDRALPRSAGYLAVASLKLVRGPTGQLSYHADTLVSFLWAQVFELREKAVFRCSICNKFALAPNKKFASLPERTGRPPEYCSNACRSKAYRQRLVARVAGSGK